MGIEKPLQHSMWPVALNKALQLPSIHILQQCIRWPLHLSASVVLRGELVINSPATAAPRDSRKDIAVTFVATGVAMLPGVAVGQLKPEEKFTPLAFVAPRAGTRLLSRQETLSALAIRALDPPAVATRQPLAGTLVIPLVATRAIPVGTLHIFSLFRW